VRAIAIKKADEELQVVWAEVYPPGVPDSQGDFMTAETIREMAWGFMKKGAVTKIDVQHDQKESGSYVVETFVARPGDPDFIRDSWVLGVKIPDPEVWEQVKKRELNGFSIDGFAFRKATKLEIELPDVLEGETDEVQGHSHSFEVGFDDQGNFLGGATGPGPDGHVHAIVKGTLTETTDGHAHRFSFVEGVLSAQAAA
jgi:hypothetical protein